MYFAKICLLERVFYSKQLATCSMRQLIRKCLAHEYAVLELVIPESDYDHLAAPLYTDENGTNVGETCRVLKDFNQLQ